MLRSEQDFYDVTLVSDDQVTMSAHKVVLSASSPYFRNILKQNKHTQPMLCLDGVDSKILTDILDYLYFGEIMIFEESLNSFLRVAKKLQLDGWDHPLHKTTSYQLKN